MIFEHLGFEGGSVCAKCYYVIPNDGTVCPNCQGEKWLDHYPFSVPQQELRFVMQCGELLVIGANAVNDPLRVLPIAVQLDTDGPVVLADRGSDAESHQQRVSLV